MVNKGNIPLIEWILVFTIPKHKVNTRPRIGMAMFTMFPMFTIIRGQGKMPFFLLLASTATPKAKAVTSVTRTIPTDSEEARHEGRGVDTIRERSAEAAEAQLERFITQRHEKRVQTEGERREQEMWMESVARYNERERRQIRAEWYGWHCDQAERHRRTL
jgi:hypothetical protein